MELLGSINLKVASGTIVSVCQLVNVVLPAGTCAVTIIVKTFAGGGIARVGSCLPGPLVGLHNVKLGAIVSINLVSITIVIAVGVPEVAVAVFTRHSYKVESSNAATVALTEINIVFDRATKEVRSVETSRVKRGSLGKIATSVVWHDQS